MTIFLVRCPKCKNAMKYATAAKFLDSKRKRCVYCGHSFIVKERVEKKLE